MSEWPTTAVSILGCSDPQCPVKAKEEAKAKNIEIQGKEGYVGKYLPGIYGREKGERGG